MLSGSKPAGGVKVVRVHLRSPLSRLLWAGGLKAYKKKSFSRD